MSQGYKEKLNKGLKFIQDLKSNSRISPFLEPDTMERFGLFDFRYINRKVIKLSTIDQKVKQNKYLDFQQFFSDLRLAFEMFSNYVPLTDPLQDQVKYFLNEVEKWKNQIENNMPEQPSARPSAKNKGLSDQKEPGAYHHKAKHYQSQREKKIKNYAKLEEEKQRSNPFRKAYRQPTRSNLAQKLQMVYFLKSNQQNEPFIHMIGDIYNIGKQTQDEYVIKLDNSTFCSWLEVLQNNNSNPQEGDSLVLQ